MVVSVPHCSSALLFGTKEFLVFSSNMRRKKSTKKLPAKGSGSRKFRTMLQCLCSGEQIRADEMLPFPDCHGEAHYSLDSGNIEEAESSLRGTGPLNYEEARALLGRYEYQKGNIEAALHVFEGIDITSVIPKIKITLVARIGDHHRRRSEGEPTPPLSIRAVSLVFEAMYLKAKSLQSLGKFKEAAQSCKVILDIVESSLPDGLPENFGADSKLQETLTNAVELLPELWKLANFPNDAILSYRRALLHRWNLDGETAARIQKEFAIYLLYSGSEASPPNLRSQLGTSFVPTNNLEEAILLLMILLRKVNSGVIERDPSIVDHLSYALAVSNQPHALACVIEGLPPGIIERKEMYHTLALCYHAEGDNMAALNLLRILLHHSEDPNNIPCLLMASEICSEIPNLAEEGIAYARRALEIKEDACPYSVGLTNLLLGMLLSEYAESATADTERVMRQSEAIQVLENAKNLTKSGDPTVLYHLSLQYAEQRKLDIALSYAKKMLTLEGGTNPKGWLLLARILSGKKLFIDAEAVVDAALEQTAKWDQGELLRTKAKLQIAQGRLKKAIETYSQLLAILQVKSKSMRSGKKLQKNLVNHDQQLELQTWDDLARIYISLSRWNDAEICLSKAKVISPNCASRWQAIGSLHEAKGLYKEALDAYSVALDIDPQHVPSLISSAMVLKRLNSKCDSVTRSYLMNALKLDRTNHVAWYNLGLLYKSDNNSLFSEAAECFEAAAFLEETAPVEPFR